MYQCDIETDTTVELITKSEHCISVDFNTKADLVYDQRDQGETTARC